MPGLIAVSEFVEETREDYNSPTTSTFVSRMPQCRQTITSLEEVSTNKINPLCVFPCNLTEDFDRWLNACSTCVGVSRSPRWIRLTIVSNRCNDFFLFVHTRCPVHRLFPWMSLKVHATFAVALACIHIQFPRIDVVNMRTVDLRLPVRAMYADTLCRCILSP